MQDPDRFDLRATLGMAWNVGLPGVPLSELQKGLAHVEAGVRYWAAVALQERGVDALVAQGDLVDALGDDSPSVQIAAAEALIEMGHPELALPKLGEIVRDDRPWVALQAARALALLGDRAKPLVDVMKKVIDENRSKPGSRRPYKDFNYASFTGWALEWALEACGEPYDFGG